jgi:dTDP-4-amino-4,6-dideoxygalactose transaminase
LSQVQAVLRRGAAAIVVVHTYGYPVDLGEVKRLAGEMGAVVIEDAAQAAGARLDGRPVGAQSSLAVLSFGRGKGHTGGSGGALLAYDDAGARAVQRARGLLGAPRRGWPEFFTVAAQLVFERPSLYGLPATLPFLHLGETIYRSPQPMRRPSSVSSPVVAATWHVADQEIETRRRNAERLLAALRWEIGFDTIKAAGDAHPGYLRLPVLASPPVRRSAIAPRARRLGVMPGYPRALCDLDRFGARCLNRDADFSGSRLLSARLCTLPTHSYLGTRDLERLELWVRTAGRL